MYTFPVLQISLREGWGRNSQVRADQLCRPLRVVELGQYERGRVREQLFEGLQVAGMVQQLGELHGDPPTAPGRLQRSSEAR